jgi:hypothetical protein
MHVQTEQQFRKETLGVVDIGVVEEDYFSEWASRIPTFPFLRKTKLVSIRVVIDFRKLNLL